MTVAASQPGPQASAPAKRSKLNRWDSPWLNPKLLIGLSMVLFIASMALWGPLVWDVNEARVASAPLNLPPPWAPGYRVTPEPVVAPPPAVAATSVPATAAPAAGDAGAGGDSGSSSITGGNPFAQQDSGSDAGGSAITGGNPFAQQDDSGSAITGGNPLAQQETVEGEATPKPMPAGVVAQQTGGSGSRFGTPSWEHPLGTESSGRDMLAVMLVGAPRSLWIGIIAAGIGMIVGIILGFTAGFMGGWVDAVIRTLADAFITIPSLAVLIVISAFVSLNNITYMALMLSLFAWPGPTRLIRSQVLSMRERGYVQMASLSGASMFSIMFAEIMPNLLPYLAASFTGNVSGAILAATGLEVLGLGPTRVPTLGITIFYAIRAAAILRGMWWWWGTPIVALIFIFTGLFLMTIGLDEIANPRLRGVKNA